MRSYVIEIESSLPGADCDAVWRHIASWDGVNYELWPFSMTFPARFASIADIPADGEVHFTSTVRVGWLPIDRHRFSLRDASVGEFFDERSSTLQLREWVHRRTLRQDGASVVVRDECTLTPRFRLLGGLLAKVYRWVFRRRHKRLRGVFGLTNT